MLNSFYLVNLHTHLSFDYAVTILLFKLLSWKCTLYKSTTLSNKKPAYGRDENLHININKDMRILHQILYVGTKAYKTKINFIMKKAMLIKQMTLSSNKCSQD